MKKFSILFTDQIQEVVKRHLRDIIGDMVVSYHSKKYQIDQLISQKKQLLKQKLDQNADQKLFEEFHIEIAMFCWNLSVSPGIWVEMLNDEQIISESSVIDLYLFISKMYCRLIQKGQKNCLYFKQFATLVDKELLYLLEIITGEIAFVYNMNRKLIVQQIDELNSDTKSIKLINKYIIYKLLRQLSEKCYEKIKQNLLFSVFTKVQPKLVDIFTNFIIQKHQIISFENLGFQKQALSKQKQIKKGLEDQFAEKLLYLCSNMKRIEYREAIRDDGKRALYLEVEQDIETGNSSRLTSYLVQINPDEQIVFMNCNLMRKKWSFSKNKSQKAGIQQLVKERKSFVNTLRSAPTNIQKITITQNISSIGGSLGNCLANLRNYDSIGSFVLDFSKKTIISSSLNYLVQKIPMIGYFLVLGGFSYTFYHLISNKFKNDKKKMQDIGKIAFSTSSSFGASFIGAFVGSSLIPIPMLGLFIGSIVGGFIGGLSSDVLLNYLQSTRFQKICIKIEKLINPNGSWTATSNLLDILGVEKQFFYDHIPTPLEKRMNCDDLWISIICFCLLSFYESKKRTKQMEQRLAKSGDQTQTQLNQIDGGQYISLNLELALGNLQRQEIIFRKYLKAIERFIQKMFDRI